MELLYLSRRDVETTALGMSEIIEILDRAFKEKGKGNVEMPPKPGIHPLPDAFLHAMPACISGLQSAGIKWVSGYPGNKKKGLPYISGLMILNDFETGIPQCVMDCTWVTAYRTGAATGLAARYLARPGSKTAGVLACGVQGRTNLEAFNTLFPLEKAYAYDIDPEVQKHYVEEMSASLNLEITGVDTPKQAVENSDLVITSGPMLKHPNPVIEAGWLQPGSFACALDYNSYWKSEALEEMDLFITDDLAQIPAARAEGFLGDAPDPVCDLGQIAAGLHAGRTDPRQRTMAMNFGLAMCDIAVGAEVYRRAREKGIGMWLPL
ncbi:MAG: ornithine cyclodeaminase family protein [Chloroflexi bacterium]|nr:ornithine cyclodeaminase family protein [Chloroflexota bacterium]